SIRHASIQACGGPATASGRRHRCENAEYLARAARAVPTVADMDTNNEPSSYDEGAERGRGEQNARAQTTLGGDIAPADPVDTARESVETVTNDAVAGEQVDPEAPLDEAEA